MLSVVSQPMGKKKMGRPTTGRDDVTVRLDRSVAAKVKTLAAHQGKPVGEVLATLLANPLDRAVVAMIKDMESPKSKPEAK